MNLLFKYTYNNKSLSGPLAKSELAPIGLVI